MRKLFFALTVVAVLCASAVAFAQKDADLEGVIGSIYDNDLTLVVDGVTVATTPETIIMSNQVAILFTDLDVGNTVRIFGEYEGDTLVARKICKMLLLKTSEQDPIEG
jgi:hypothetical protein